MKRRLFALLILLAGIIAVLTLGIYYFCDLSRQKVFLEKHLTALLQRPAHIQNVHLQIFPQTRIILKKVEIKEPDGKSGFISIEKLHLGISLKLLLARTLQINYLILDHPRFTLIRTENKRFNFSDLANLFSPPRGAKKEQKKPWFAYLRLLLKTLIIRKGEIEFKDYVPPRAPHTLHFLDLDFRAHKISRGTIAPFALTGSLKSKEDHARINLKGKLGPILEGFTMTAMRWRGNLEATNLPISTVWHYVPGWEEIGSLEGTLTGTIVFKGTLGRKLETSGTLKVSNLMLENKEIFEKNLKINQPTLTFSLVRDRGRIILPHFTVAFPQGKATGRFLLNKNNIPVLETKMEIKNVDYQSAIPYFPFPLFPKPVRRIMTEEVTNGTIETLSLRFSKTFDQAPHSFANEWFKSIAGSIRFRDLSLKTLENFSPIQQLQGVIRMEGGEVAITNLSGVLGNTNIEQGTITVSELNFLDLSADLDLDLLDVFRLLTSPNMPLEVRQPAKNLNALSGKARLTLDVSGPVTDPGALTFGGRMELLNASVNYRPFRKAGKELTGTIQFTPYTIMFHNIQGLWEDSPFVCTGGIEDYRTRGSQINVHVASESALVNDLVSAFFPWKDVGGNGVVSIAIDFSCQGYRSETLHFNGQAELSDISLSFPAFPQPFSHINGTLGFSSEGISFSKINFKSGSSELTLTGFWDKLRQPSITGAIEGFFVDLLDFYQPRKPEEERPSPNYTLNGVVVRIRNGRYKDLAFDDLETVVDFRNGILSLPSLRVKKGKYRDFDFVNLDTGDKNQFNAITYHNKAATIPFLRLESQGGSWTGKDVTLSLRPGKENAFSLNNEIQNIPIENLLEGFLPKMRKLTGTLSLAGHTSGEGENVSDRMETLDGEITFTIKDGILKKFNLLSKLFSLLNVSRIFRQDYGKLLTKGMYYDIIEGSFQIEKGIARTDNLLLDSSSMKMNAVGDIDLGKKNLDLEVAVQPLETVDKIVEKIPLLGTILMGDEGAVVISYYKVTGSFDNPKIDPVVFQSLGRKGQGIFRRIFKLPETILNPTGN